MTLPVRTRKPISHLALLLTVFTLVSCGGSSTNEGQLEITFFEAGTSTEPAEISLEGNLIATVPPNPYAAPISALRNMPVSDIEMLTVVRPSEDPLSILPSVGRGPQYWGVLNRNAIRLLTFDSPAPNGQAKIRHILGEDSSFQRRLVLLEFSTGKIVASKQLNKFVQREEIDISLNTLVESGKEYITEVRDETSNALLDRFGRFTAGSGKNYLIVSGRRGTPVGRVLVQPD